MNDKKRKNRQNETIEALETAQKLSFAPLSFAAVGSLLELGILKEIDLNPNTYENIAKKFSYNDYTLKTLLEVGVAIGVVSVENDVYSTTKTGKVFLYDEMTRVNFNFVKDVCYIGADKLTSSFLEGSPNGLKEIYKDAKTIYPYLSVLPEKMKKSWYEFDHYYSNTCFDLIYDIMFKNSDTPVFDIGGNTGIFAKLCLKKNPNNEVTIVDLPANIDYIRNEKELEGCKFVKADILSEDYVLPFMSGKILMSQFLDCFSAEQIVYILKRLYKNSDENIKIYILEPFIDNQRFKGAEVSLVHTSLYFTCMANGCSKMYSKKDMESFIKLAGFKVNEAYTSVGIHDYTLLECVKDV